MPHVGRVKVTVEIVDDDGSTTIHEAYGVPWEHRTPSITIEPSIGDDGLPYLAMVSMDVALIGAPDGGAVFTAESTPPTMLTITEGTA
ncbi:hypothetical protein QC999_gp10 [Microbacterium phage Cressida]|uniref:Uncharacterized protein n=1 Tax=Microbacterium phage Cressida TaxID=2591216 RepID=A0A514DI22_9CAUD|nr:hypothetical protein QC999_gp10 [Microbacterium phage Cressida]QDH93253.1 hypothetical protein PBI_CRESSIDA_10 [Microbacterium phage Cressida]